MRIIYDFHGKDPQVTGSGKPYSMGPVSQPPQWKGFFAELLIIDSEQPHDGQPLHDGDAVYLEGDGEIIIKALEESLSLMKMVRDNCREHAEESIARTVQCNICHMYYDTKDEWHGDGKGRRCGEQT